MLAEAQGMRTSDENGSPGPGTSRRTFGRGTFGNVFPASFAADAASRAESSNSTTNSIGLEEGSPNRHVVLPIIDPFYSKRDEWRGGGGFSYPDATYLEEKCLFWQQKSAEVENSDWQTMLERRRHSLTSSVALRPSSAPRQHSLPSRASPALRRIASSSNLTASSFLGERSTACIRHLPPCLVRIHRHLADRHLLGCAAIDDQDGRIKSVSLSLGADFFHPLFSSKSFRSTALTHAGARAKDAILSASGIISAGSGARESDTRALAPQAAGEEMNPLYSIGVDAPDVELEVYSSSSIGITKTQGACAHRQPMKDDPSLLGLRSRIVFYQRKLDSHLAHYQSVAFDESLLDFWDEFLPATKGVHFHDGHTPVPRMVDLHRFLTSPCPKSYGTIQCEIERIKTTSSKKGVNVKGRLFPSYQYRLFIRDKRQDELTESGNGAFPSRCDTMLMIAKYKDKEVRSTSGPGQSTTKSTGKRGVNSYHLYMPTDRDIQSHFLAVNDATECKESHGPDQRLFPSADKMIPREVGRLQSNFIGTEFQIFATSFSKRQSQSLRLNKGSARSFRGCSKSSSFDSASGSDIEDMEASSVISQDTCSSLYSSQEHTEMQNGLMLSKTSRNRRSSNVSSNVSCSEEATDVAAPNASSTIHQSRRRSWPTLRYSRRAIAHDISDKDGPRDIFNKKRLAEEELGVITYTANLLGNRPRIMDVCIPKISDGGTVSPAWKSHMDAALEMGMDESMMSRFKQLQQFDSQQENHQGGAGQNNLESGDNRSMSPDGFGLLTLQNRPPWWNAELGAFVLNFGGRVSVASVKNFQLCERNNQEHVMLQFGRIEGRHSFTMDFQHPLSATQAFAM